MSQVFDLIEQNPAENRLKKIVKTILRKKKEAKPPATEKASKRGKATAYTDNLEKRDKVLFTRVTDNNKEFISRAAAQKGISKSVFVNHILSWYQDNVESTPG